MYMASPAVTGVPKAVGSSAVVRRSGLQAAVHPSLDVQICEVLKHPFVLSRGTFVELWMFYTLQD